MFYSSCGVTSLSFSTHHPNLLAVSQVHKMYLITSSLLVLKYPLFIVDRLVFIMEQLNCTIVAVLLVSQFLIAGKIDKLHVLCNNCILQCLVTPYLNMLDLFGK